MNRSVTAPAAVDYPSSDGQPMAESEFQLIPLIDAISALRSHFADREDVYVVGNMFLYYEEGNPRAVVAPDVFAVIGTPKHMRHSYKLWEEPKAPGFVLEVTSRSTRNNDQQRKREVYASLGVEEYWLYDPTGGLPRPAPAGIAPARRSLPAAALRDDDGRWPEPAQPDARARRAARGGEGAAVPRPCDRAGSPRLPGDAGPDTRRARGPPGDEGASRGGDRSP